MIAVHLLKWVYWNQDVLGKDMVLQYFRDIDGREVDFVITEDKKPIVCIECKVKDENPSKHLVYFIKKFPSCKAWQVTLDGNKNVTTKEGIRIAPAEIFLATLI
jgi:predicted AAA+ superfamily ATPase